MQPQLSRELVSKAVLIAVWQWTTPEAVILHSDRGKPYTAHEFQELLKTHGIVSSMSGVGNCYDNAPMESFFGTLKRELAHHENYATMAEAKASIFESIEVFHFHQHKPSPSNGQAPLAFEA